MGETAPFWRFSAVSYPDLEVAIPSPSRLSSGVDAVNQISNESSGVRNHKCPLTWSLMSDVFSFSSL